MLIYIIILFLIIYKFFTQKREKRLISSGSIGFALKLMSFIINHDITNINKEKYINMKDFEKELWTYN